LYILFLRSISSPQNYGRAISPLSDKSHLQTLTSITLPGSGYRLFLPEMRGKMDKFLLEKYDRPAPRYTSYPTAPYWQDNGMSAESWRSHLIEAYRQSADISLYIHLPYCEKLCTYCGCNKRITTNHGVEQPYISSILQEWQLYLQALPGKPRLREIHLGGGTPTFFSPANLRQLLEPILASADVPPDFEGSFEAHPASTSHEHLQALYDLGFRRVSVGVQDFDPFIMSVINRSQTEEQVAQVTAWARAIGYASVNFDLIFGLPFQTPDHIRANVAKVKAMRPDRIAFYSYAHVPWIKPSQRAYSEADLPLGADKRALYELGCDLLLETGYHEIGMDHFALPHDTLAQAHAAGRLHRNFMGYTAAHTYLSIGLGASAIGDTWTAFAQNEKQVEAYQARVARGEFPLIRGYALSAEDRILRRHILNLMCQQHTHWRNEDSRCPELYAGLSRLAELEADGLVVRGDRALTITEAGRPFLRNICLAFDAHYWAAQPQTPVFSRL